MRSWFARRTAVVGGPDTAEPLDAYKEGRRDERNRLERDQTLPRKADIDEAYDRGRHDERLRRKGSPLVTLFVLVAVIAAAGFVYLAVRNGSFSNGGAVVDQSLSTAQAPIRGAADKAGDALQNAGQTLKQSAGQPAKN